MLRGRGIIVGKGVKGMINKVMVVVGGCNVLASDVLAEQEC